GVEVKQIEVNYAVGDRVEIVDGPLEGFTGVVEELDLDKNRVKVVVSMFGRETPVELELDQAQREN
ncbi:KOW motif-containing protein, partial [Ligaoa zhengdingensis]